MMHFDIAFVALPRLDEKSLSRADSFMTRHLFYGATGCPRV